MNQTQFFILYISLFILEFITIYTLNILNIGSVLKNRKDIPDMFKDQITMENYEKSIAYTLKKEHFSIFRLIISSAVTLTMLFSGILGYIESCLLIYISSTTLMGLAYIGVISLILGLLDFPLSLYSTFVIEEEFGFNKMDFKSYISDQIKQFVLSVIIGVIILVALFFFMDKTGDGWWVWASIFFISFQLLLFIIYPNFIAPIFNKFTPLEDGELKDRLELMASKAAFKLTAIYIMDGSKRSGHSNAYFTGIGSSKRIVLYDTLVEKLTTAELSAVLAHEIGHWKKGHIRKRLLLTMITVPVAFLILSLLLKYNPLFELFSLKIGTYYGLLILIMMISGPFTFFLSPISNHMSRKHEFEADDFAIDQEEDNQTLITALLKLSKDNLSNLTPDKLYSAYYYSHPPLIERIKNLKKGDVSEC